MKTHALFFPFDLFDASGTRAGVELLADAVRELIADNRREKKATRARAYTNKVRIEEFVFNQLADYQNWRSEARQAAAKVWQAGDRLLWVAGSHLGVLPVYEAFGSLPGNNLVIQFDAHLDIHHFSDCKTELSHGNFLLHAEGPLPKIVNVGHRDLLLTKEHIHKHFQQTFSAAELAIDPAAVANAVRNLAITADRVFVDIDGDVLDPSFFPATAHTVAFGMSPGLLLQLLAALDPLKVVGLAFSEFDPGRDVRDQSLHLLMWLIEYWLLELHETRKHGPQ